MPSAYSGSLHGDRSPHSTYNGEGASSLINGPRRTGIVFLPPTCMYPRATDQCGGLDPTGHACTRPPGVDLLYQRHQRPRRHQAVSPTIFRLTYKHLKELLYSRKGVPPLYVARSYGTSPCDMQGQYAHVHRASPLRRARHHAAGAYPAACYTLYNRTGNSSCDGNVCTIGYAGVSYHDERQRGRAIFRHLCCHLSLVERPGHLQTFVRFD